MTKRLLLIASVSGMLAVAFGAMAAHKLKELITPYQIEIFQKGVTYQFYHTFAILAAALLLDSFNSKQFYTAGILFLTGIFCFSGSLYALALNDYLHISTKIIGPVTPVGGLFFIAGWFVLLTAILKTKGYTR
jgi:uncharacterized membrane protein YgdD (TMEM256/DUF423 family)